MKVYVAGGFEERELVKSWMDRLRKEGITITHDWTAAEASAPGVTSDAELTAEQAARFAREDLLGVHRADLIWHIVASYKGARGSYFEAGFAYGLRRPIIVSGPDWRKTIFHHLTNRQFDTHEEAFDCIAVWAETFPALGYIRGL